MNSQKRALLQALDIPVWIQKRRHREEAPCIERKSSIQETSVSDPTGNVLATLGQTQRLSLEALRQCVANCQLCPLHLTRTQTVFGVGNEKAKLMIIGEAPGFYEDQQGEPFVGRAGQLLNAMLQSIGLDRSDVYIANILKCRPPNNRDPVATEVLHCTPYLKQQIALIQPSVLCAVGKVAAHYLLNTTESLGRLRGKIHRYGESQLPLFITYHPAYLLRNPSAKTEAYRDLLHLQNMVNQMKLSL